MQASTQTRISVLAAYSHAFQYFDFRTRTSNGYKEATERELHKLQHRHDNHDRASCHATVDVHILCPTGRQSDVIEEPHQEETNVKIIYVVYCNSLDEMANSCPKHL